MKYIPVELPQELEKKYLVPLSDLHIGDKRFNLKKLKGYLDWIMENDALIILNGDILTADIKSSVGNVYEAAMKPQEQLDLAIEILKPFSDKIVGIVEGNHEARISREVGIDVTKILATSLGRQDFYDPDSVLLHIRLGRDRFGKKIGYSIFSVHGWSSGRRAGSKLNAIQELRNIVVVDCYIASHTHTQGAVVEKIIVPDVRNRKLLDVKQTFVSAGSFLDYGGYSERKGMPIAKLGSPRIRLDGTRKDLHVSV